ncbi:MAG: hypothetical protein Q9225_003422 [Loekoesia sp. 1 TL-2023]
MRCTSPSGSKELHRIPTRSLAQQDPNPAREPKTMPDSDNKTEIPTVSTPQLVVQAAGQVVYSIKIKAIVFYVRGSPTVLKVMYPMAAAAEISTKASLPLSDFQVVTPREKIGGLPQAYFEGDEKLPELASYIQAKRS